MYAPILSSSSLEQYDEKEDMVVERSVEKLSSNASKIKILDRRYL